MRGLVIAVLVCAPAVASAQSVDVKGWTSDGDAVVAINQGMNPWSGSWISDAQPDDDGNVWAVCTPAPILRVEENGGDDGCKVCKDAASCGLAVDASGTKSSLKSPNKKLKVKDKRSCAKDPNEFGGKRCTRAITVGKLGTFSYQEAWFKDKAPMHVIFRPDSGAAVVSFDASGRMDGVTWTTMYVVDLGGSGGGASASAGGGDTNAQILCGIVDGDQVTQVVPDKKKSRVGGVVRCAIHQTGGAAGTVQVQTSWKGGTGPAHTADVTPDKDAEIDLTPVDGDDAHPDFVPCTDFQIVAQMGSWTQTLKVPQKCSHQPKGKLACTYADADGKIYDELKLKYRMPDDATLTCKLTGLDLADGAADAWIDVKGAQAQNRVHASLDTDTLVFEIPVADVSECDTTTFAVTVVDDQNIPWFTKTVSLTEDCPD